MPAGPIAFIDINDARGVPAGPDTNGNYWNSTATTTDSVALVDTSNAPTGWTLDTRIFPAGGGTGLSGGLNNPIAPPAPYNIQQAYADSWYDNNSGGGKGEFSFLGLDSSNEYELKLFGARTNGVLGNIAFTAGTGAPFALVSGSMLTVTATPDASGVITFEFNKGIPGTGSTADLNLMSIQEIHSTQVIPEPSTLVIWALGLLGLRWWSWRRRHCD